MGIIGDAAPVLLSIGLRFAIVATVMTLTAESASEPKEISWRIPDAEFDYDRIESNPAEHRVVVKLLQEPRDDSPGLPQPALVRSTPRFREYAQPYLRCWLTVPGLPQYVGTASGRDRPLTLGIGDLVTFVRVCPRARKRADPRRRPCDRRRVGGWGRVRTTKSRMPTRIPDFYSTHRTSPANPCAHAFRPSARANPSVYGRFRLKLGSECPSTAEVRGPRRGGLLSPGRHC